MRVANIVFNPFTNDSRVEKISKSLCNNGYKVEVIAHLDKNLPENELKDEYKVKRFIYLNRKETTSKLLKLFIYINWVKEVVKYAKDFDILHCNDLNTLPIGVIIKKFFNKDIKIVYDAHEYETQTNGLSGIQKKLTKILEKSLIKYANSVITVSDSIANEYTKLYNIKKPVVVLNTPLYKEKKKYNLFRENLGIDKEKTIFLYQGGLSSGRGIEILLDTFKNLQNENIVIVFMGYGLMEEEIKKISKECDNIYFHPAVSPDVLLNYTSSADFGISTIEDSCLSYRYSLPNKMFEYLMANIPVIVSDLPEMKKVIQNYNVGVVAKNNTPQGLKEAIKEAVKFDKKELQKNIQKVKEVYNWQNQEKVLLKVYEELK